MGAVAAAAFVVVPAFAGGGATVCNGGLAPGTYQRVVVPQGGVCLSDGPVTIRGGLFIQEGATLVFGSEENPVATATINGGVHATNAMNVQIHFSTINGGSTSMAVQARSEVRSGSPGTPSRTAPSTAVTPRSATTASGTASFATTFTAPSI